jgi:hypothetical protein
MMEVEGRGLGSDRMKVGCDSLVLQSHSAWGSSASARHDPDSELSCSLPCRGRLKINNSLCENYADPLRSSRYNAADTAHEADVG